MSAQAFAPGLFIRDLTPPLRLGDFKGKAWRIGLMGYNSRPNCVFQVLAALESVLRGMGAKLEPGKGVAAAEMVYAS